MAVYFSKETFMTRDDPQVQSRKPIFSEDKKHEMKRGLSERKYLEMTQFER